MQALKFDPARQGPHPTFLKVPESRAFPTSVLPRPARWLATDSRPLDWNGPVERPFIPFFAEDLDRPIIAGLEAAARRDPGRIALSDPGGSLTFAQLWDSLSGLAEDIAARTRPGDLIGIILPVGVMTPVAMLACLAAGRVFMLLDPTAPAAWLDQVLEDARPALLIVGGDLVIGAPAMRIMRLTSLPAAASKGWRPAPCEIDQPACVLFTSGSTGRPKGVVNSQRALLQRAAQSINAAHINAEDRFLTLASPGSIVEVRDILTALLAGASIHLIDARRLGARQVLEVVRTQAITVMFAFPALLRTLLAAAEGARASEVLRLVRVGGDAALWSDVERLRGWLAPGAAIQSIYAATEAPMMQWFIDGSCRGDDPRIPIGYPLPGARLFVVDEAGAAVTPGEVGELMVEGPCVALGQWIDGRCAAASSRRFHTGDMVRQRADGLLERLGRKDRQVKIRGARVELDGVEAALRRHPHLRDVGALARTSDGAAILVAYVSAGDGASAKLLDELKTLMRQAPAAMRPSRIYLVPEIPRLPSSKLDLRALALLDEATIRAERTNAAEAGPQAGDVVTQAVARAWRDVLAAPVGGPEEDFFDAGGDSLKAVALVIELERALGLELCPSLVHEAPTFAGLCQALRAQRPAAYVPLVPLKAGEGPCTLFFVHGMGGSVADLFPIARSLAWPGPVVGIQARGLLRGDAPHVTVEAMAEEYLAAIRARQPQGPYHLCGYSFGGLVAFEMARRLAAAGQEVGLVGLFDTLTNAIGWPLPLWLAFAHRRAVRFAAGVAAAPIRTWPASIRDVGRRALDKLAGLLAQTPPSGSSIPSFLKSAPASVLKVAASAMLASARYEPGFYPGELKLFTPEERDPALPSPMQIWRRYAAAVSVIAATGDHLTMLSTPNAASVAASLSRCLPADAPCSGALLFPRG